MPYTTEQFIHYLCCMWCCVCLLFHFRFSHSVLYPAMWLVLCMGGSFIVVVICISLVQRHMQYMKVGNCLFKDQEHEGALIKCLWLSLKYLLRNRHYRLLLFMVFLIRMSTFSFKMDDWEICFWFARIYPLGSLADSGLVKHKRKA